MKKSKKNNVVNFPSILTNGEREVEAILFAAAEPLDIDTIESKISKNINVKKVLEKLQEIYLFTTIMYIFNPGSIHTDAQMIRLQQIIHN